MLMLVLLTLAQAPKAIPPESVTANEAKAKAVLSESIAQAMKSHPDVKLAEAKKLVAEAELEQARLLVTQRLTAAHTKVDHAQATMQETQTALTELKTLGSNVSASELRAARLVMMRAYYELAAVEAELLAAKGGPKPAVEAPSTAPPGSITPLNPSSPQTPASKDSKANRAIALVKANPKLGEFLHKRVKLDIMGVSGVADVVDLLKKSAGGEDLTVRLPGSNGGMKVKGLKGENSVLAWLQLVADDATDNAQEPYKFYVRDYGLMFALADTTPADVVTLEEFAKLMKP